MKRAWASLFALLLACALSACERSRSMSTDEGALASSAPVGVKSKSLGMHGYNYTDLPISSYSVSGAGWGGDVRVSSETTGGGGTTCCASVPDHLPAKYVVRWSRDDHRWCEIDVIFKGPIPDNPRFFNTHFFQDGHVEITISYEFTDLLIKMPNLNDGMSRKAAGNVVMDEKFARCKDAN